MKLHYPLAQFDVQCICIWFIANDNKLNDIRMFDLVRLVALLLRPIMSPSAVQSWLSEKYSQTRSREVIAVTQLPFAAQRVESYRPINLRFSSYSAWSISPLTRR